MPISCDKALHKNCVLSTEAFVKWSVNRILPLLLPIIHRLKNSCTSIIHQQVSLSPTEWVISAFWRGRMHPFLMSVLSLCVQGPWKHSLAPWQSLDWLVPSGWIRMTAQSSGECSEYDFISHQNDKPRTSVYKAQTSTLWYFSQRLSQTARGCLIQPEAVSAKQELSPQSKYLHLTVLWMKLLSTYLG